MFWKKRNGADSDLTIKICWRIIHASKNHTQCWSMSRRTSMSWLTHMLEDVTSCRVNSSGVSIFPELWPPSPATYFSMGTDAGNKEARLVELDLIHRPSFHYEIYACCARVMETLPAGDSGLRLLLSVASLFTKRDARLDESLKPGQIVPQVCIPVLRRAILIHTQHGHWGLAAERAHVWSKWSGFPYGIRSARSFFFVFFPLQNINPFDDWMYLQFKEKKLSIFVFSVSSWGYLGYSLNASGCNAN